MGADTGAEIKAILSEGPPQTFQSLTGARVLVPGAFFYGLARYDNNGFTSGNNAALLYDGCDIAYLVPPMPVTNGHHDSHTMVWGGTSYDGSPHYADWKFRVNMTTNAGANKFVLEKQFDFGGYSTVLTMSSTGNLGLGGMTSPAVPLDVTNPVTGNAQIHFKDASVTAGGGYLIGVGTEISGMSAAVEYVNGVWTARTQALAGAGTCGLLFINGGALQFFNSLGTTNGNSVSFTNLFQISPQGSCVLGAAAIATNATDGFLYITSCPGPPTGTPTANTGRVPMVYDSTNNQIYVYNGSWKKTAALT